MDSHTKTRCRGFFCVAMVLTVMPFAAGFSTTTGARLLFQPTALPLPSRQAPGPFGRTIRHMAPPDADAEPEEFVVKVKVDPIVKETSILLRRLSWLTWWSQLILTTVSSITLIFARNVIGAQVGVGIGGGGGGVGTSVATGAVLPNFLLAGISIALSFGSIFWTWASRRLARRLLRKPTKPLQAAQMLRKSIKAGVTLNLFGMLTSLISAEQIVGALAIKVLTSAPARTTVALLESSSNYLQPLDILVVQANTNTLFSHFTSLAALLYMTRPLAKLDPPSRKSDK